MEQHSEFGWVILAACVIIWLMSARKKRRREASGVIFVPVSQVPVRKRENWLLIAVLLVGLLVAWHYATWMSDHPLQW